MTTCETLSDRLPVLAHGAAWREDERQHVATCHACRAEWDIVRTAAALGRNLEPVDAEAVASRVVARLRAEPVRPRNRARGRGIAVATGLAAGLAAALALAVVVTRPHRQPERGGPAVAATTNIENMRVPLAELDEYDAPELSAALDRLDASPTDAPLDVPLPDDIDNLELERIVRSWES